MADSFVVLNATPSSAVATNGTIAFTVPSPYAASSFASYGHQMFVEGHQKLYKEDAGGITVSISGTTATVTYKGSTSIPAGALVRLQLNIAGADDGRIDALPEMLRMTKSGLFRIDFGAPITADADGICASQSISATASLDGALVAASRCIFDVPRNVVGAWTTTAIATVTGKDEYGNTVVEKSASGTTLTGKKAFKEVTSITVSTAVTSATFGTGDVLGFPVFVEKANQIVQEVQDGVFLSRKSGKVYLQGLFVEANVDAATGLNIVCPVAGYISKLTTMCNSAVTTGGDITVEVNTVAVTGLAVTVANSSAEGDMDTDTPTTWHGSTTVVAVGDRIEFQFASAMNASADFYFVLEIDVTDAGMLDGTFVAGVVGVQSATTGDVRGTYDPSNACDGAAVFSIIARLSDPTYKGGDQYAG